MFCALTQTSSLAPWRSYICSTLLSLELRAKRWIARGMILICSSKLVCWNILIYIVICTVKLSLQTSQTSHLRLLPRNALPGWVLRLSSCLLPHICLSIVNRHADFGVPSDFKRFEFGDVKRALLLNHMPNFFGSR